MKLRNPLSTKYDLVANICHDSLVSVSETLNASISKASSASSSTAPSNTNSGSAGNSAGSSGTTKTVLENGCYRIHTKVALFSPLLLHQLFFDLLLQLMLLLRIRPRGNGLSCKTYMSLRLCPS